MFHLHTTDVTMTRVMQAQTRRPTSDVRERDNLMVSGLLEQTTRQDNLKVVECYYNSRLRDIERLAIDDIDIDVLAIKAIVTLTFTLNN